jgi:hypothetical protein
VEPERRTPIDLKRLEHIVEKYGKPRELKDAADEPIDSDVVYKFILVHPISIKHLVDAIPSIKQYITADSLMNDELRITIKDFNILIKVSDGGANVKFIH